MAHYLAGIAIDDSCGRDTNFAAGRLVMSLFDLMPAEVRVARGRGRSGVRDTQRRLAPKSSGPLFFLMLAFGLPGALLGVRLYRSLSD